MDNTVSLRSQSHGHSFQLISFVVQELLLMYCLCTGFISPQDGNVTCTVPPVDAFQDATLSCYFPEDLNKTKRDFSVFHKPTHPDSESKIECWWLSGELQCSAKSGIKYQTSVSKIFHITILNVTSVITGLYSCQLDNYDPNLFQTCKLDIKEKVDSPEEADHSVKAWAAGVSLALIILGVVAATFIVLRHKKAVLAKCRRGQRNEHPEEAHGLMEAITESEPDSVGKSFQEHLVNKVSEMYPNVPDPFHFVPPVYFNRTRYRRQTVAGQLVYVPDPPDPSDVRHDRAMQHVIHCLRHMAESQEERMFVLTQFQYEDYLNSPDPAYLHHRLPTPAGLREDDSDVGCFDFLIVHRLHGLLVGVVKAVSDRDVGSQDNELNGGHVIVQEVTQAAQQLTKANRMIQHLMSDQQNVPNVRQTLIFPNLSRSSLRNAVKNHVEMVENLRQCLGTNALDDPTELCLCAEQLSDSNSLWIVSLTVVNNMKRCWKWTETPPKDAIMTDKLYLNITARFFGPATQSCLRVPDGYEGFALPKTLADAVSLTGDLYGRTIITPKNMELLDKPRVFLVGKPSTGKTRMMTLVGSKWLARGHNVVVVKNRFAMTDSFLSQHLKSLKTASNTQSTAEDAYGKVYEEECDFKSHKSIKKTIEVIKKHQCNKEILILLDAAQLEGKHIEEFCEKLDEQVKDLRLWARCTGRSCPAVGHGELCTEIQNCPPAVVREAAKHKPDSDQRSDAKDAPDYLPLTDGLPVKHIYHAGHRHSARSPHECQECGWLVGSLIADTLLIKTTAEGSVDMQENAVENQTGEKNVEQTTDGNRIPKKAARRVSLNFRDILIVFEFDKTFGKPDITGDHSFVRALESMDIKVQVVNTDRPNVVAVDESDDTDTAKALHIRHMQTCRTKRKIVVYVEDKSGYKDDENKLRALTSCTSQLILVHVPQQ